MTRASGRPLALLIHIPKTAGTSANAALAAHGGRGRKHIERDLGRPARLSRLAARSDWLSGHVPFAAMREAIAPLTDRPLRFFTILRDPVAQLASHYNWWIEVHARGPLSYLRQGRYFRGLSRQIRSADNSDPRQIIAILDQHAPLFLNMQSKFLLSPRPGWDAAQIAARLAEFDGLALDGDLGAMLSAMTGRALPAPKRNVARRGFDRAVFDTPEMRRFLAQHHGDDLRLYQLARDRLAGPGAWAS